MERGVDMKGKKYFLFTGDWYYPYGGARDFRGAFLSVQDAELKFAEIENTVIDDEFPFNTHQWYNVLNIETGEIVSGNDS